ncbi:expressed unknown protein [Seminavis robusta]|uniref:Uncharacterized protein n=1 Tax=Seminavis robusta TaxID=568900 RepID=A0A9N8DXN4_9STRA|nr:expressed unknown protein [Seminavis robusta]|eukprot:Sro434_g141930.1 n/a (356) ;mRNA; r:767-1834
MATDPLSPAIGLQEAIDRAGFSSFRCIADLGFVSWRPPPRNRGKGAPYRYKSLSKATAGQVRNFTVSGETAAPPSLVDSIANITVPITFRTNLPRQVVAHRYPYGQVGVASLYHAANHSARVDLETLDFFFGCSALEVLSAEKKIRHMVPYLVLKVPGTNMIMVHYDLGKIRQDYSVPGFQFERLVTGQPMSARHNVGFTEHVQVMQIGQYRVLMTAEADATTSAGAQQHPVEVKLLQQGYGGTKVFFQMVGSGSLTLCKGKNRKGVLTSVQTVPLSRMADSLAENNDTASLEQKIIRNMERLKEWDRKGWFAEGKAYRLDFNEAGVMELNAVSRRDTLLPPDAVVKELLATAPK